MTSLSHGRYTRLGKRGEGLHDREQNLEVVEGLLRRIVSDLTLEAVASEAGLAERPALSFRAGVPVVGLVGPTGRRCVRWVADGWSGIHCELEAFWLAWIYLVIAGFLEVVWATGMKYSEGFTRLGPSVVTLVAMIASFVLLSMSMRTLPLGTAYGVWTGIGAVGSVLVGIFLLGESSAPIRLFFISMILFGIVGLKYTS